MTGRTGIIAIGVAVCALALWLLCGRSAAAEAVYPVENGASWFTRHVGRRVSAVFSRVSAAAENDRLKREVDSLRMVCNDVEALQSENTRLRRMLGLDDEASRTRFSTNRWLCAQVLSHGAASGIAGTIRIGRGSFSGVRPGAVVAVPEGLVGRVGEVSPHTADVRLLTDPSMRVACEIETGDLSAGPTRGILSGGGLSPISEASASILYIVHPFRIRNIERRPDLPQRAKIITSGLGGVFPRGLVVGFLANGMLGDETKLEREGDVVPAVDFPNLDYVFIRREE